MLAVKRINELDYYRLGLYDFADKVDLNPNRALAVVKHMMLQESGNHFKLVKVGKTNSNGTLRQH